MKYFAIVALSMLTTVAVVGGIMLGATAASSTRWDRRTVLCWVGVVVAGTVFLTAMFALVEVTA